MSIIFWVVIGAFLAVVAINTAITLALSDAGWKSLFTRAFWLGKKP